MITTAALCLRWPQGHTLQYPDIHLATGHTLLLRGPSGSGKSTWLALVAGLRSCTSGSIHVHGTDVQQLTPSQRDTWRAQHIGLMPQHAWLSPALSVAHNLDLVAFASGIAPSPAHRTHVLESLEVAHLMTRRVHELSQGQKLRLALARALLRQPHLLLVDEPTANLDDDMAATAMHLLNEHAHRHGCTLVVATHDQRAVQALPNAHTQWFEADVS